MYLKADVNSVCGCRREGGGGTKLFEMNFLPHVADNPVPVSLPLQKSLLFFRYTGHEKTNFS